MSELPSGPARNVYENAVVGAVANPVMPAPDAVDEAFAAAANDVLAHTAELIRTVVRAHQGAAAIVVRGDWRTIRKVFSLSPKYAAWAEYRTPAVGFGIHAWLLSQDRPVRLTQAELEAHPAWAGFGTEAGRHPPMRGWLAAPILGRDGTNWGLLQASDREEGDFTADDEAAFARLAALTSTTLEALWDVRNLRKGDA